MHVISYEEYVNESYLQGGRAPLYHYTYNSRLASIIKDDTLKMGNPAFGYLDKDGKTRRSISVTRSTTFDNDGAGYVRLTLDSNLLRLDGYIPIPCDELLLARAIRGTKGKTDLSKVSYHTKKRPGKNGLGLVNKQDFDIEFEERFYSDIPNIKKYILAVDFKNKLDITETFNSLSTLPSTIQIGYFPQPNKVWISPIRVNLLDFAPKPRT